MEHISKFSRVRSATLLHDISIWPDVAVSFFLRWSRASHSQLKQVSCRDQAQTPRFKWTCGSTDALWTWWRFPICTRPKFKDDSSFHRMEHEGDAKQRCAVVVFLSYSRTSTFNRSSTRRARYIAMASSTTLPLTVIDYADRVRTSKERPYISKLGGLVTASRDAIVRPVELSAEPEDVEISENPEFKLPSLRSLFIIIAGNALFQVK